MRLRDAYFAKRCPERVQLDVLRPCEPLPDSLFMQKLGREGIAFEMRTVGVVLRSTDALLVEPEDAGEHERITMEALASGAST